MVRFSFSDWCARKVVSYWKRFQAWIERNDPERFLQEPVPPTVDDAMPEYPDLSDVANWGLELNANGALLDRVQVCKIDRIENPVEIRWPTAWLLRCGTRD